MDGIYRLETDKKTINILDYFDSTIKTEKVVIDHAFLDLLRSSVFDRNINREVVAMVDIKEVFYQHKNGLDVDTLEFFLKIKERVLDMKVKDDKSELRKRLATLAYFMKYQDKGQKGFLSIVGWTMVAPVKSVSGDIFCISATLMRNKSWLCRAIKPTMVVPGHCFWSRNEC